MTEQNTQIGWEERFDKVIEKWLDEDAEISLIPVVRQFIATELTKAREEGYEKGQDDAFNGRIQSMKSITITEEVNLVPELRKHIENLALQSYRQELRTKVEGMKNTRGEFNGYNKAKEDLLTIISE